VIIEIAFLNLIIFVRESSSTAKDAAAAIVVSQLISFPIQIHKFAIRTYAAAAASHEMRVYVDSKIRQNNENFSQHGKTTLS